MVIVCDNLEQNRKRKVLLVCDSREKVDWLLSGTNVLFDMVVVEQPLRALSLLSREQFDGVFVTSSHLQQVLQFGKLMQNEQILDGMPDGVVLLESDNTIVWANDRMRDWCGQQSVVGMNFYTALGSPEILGPDFCPFHTALATGVSTSSTLRSQDNRYFQVHAAPVREVESQPKHLIITVRDVTHEIHQQQKLAAIHQAGMELADLTPNEVLHMPIRDRIELLKSNIIHFTKDLLHFEVAEIRLVEETTHQLKPLLAVGMDPDAAGRDLFADIHGNGVTGFVAATGKSYLCEDTTEDPLYLEGVRGAKSSLTVPLILHDRVIGTFNVESTELRAFSESDLQFLEIFGRDVAAALNTLELLVVEKANTTAESVEAIHRAVALPIDEILNEAVNVMERYIGHSPEVEGRLKTILRNARDIKLVIQRVGQTMTTSNALPMPPPVEERPVLRDRRVLVVDADESVRSTAHGLLDRYGCIVETAHDAGEAVCMVRATSETPYDVIISDIRLPDVSGYQLMLRLQGIMNSVPLILMTGFGYDPGHSIVNARKSGLPAWAILYKPFRLDQLLGAVERTIQEPRFAAQV
jgi:GAF domain-containing protein